MRLKKVIYLFLLFLLTACQEENSISAEVYKDKRVTGYSGYLYTTKYGGLNFYIPDKQQRDELFKSKLVDSIIFNISSRRYIAKPLVRKNYSRERNNSDFSFFVDKQDNRIVIDIVDGLHTMLLFSERTDMEALKDKGVIKSQYLKK